MFRGGWAPRSQAQPVRVCDIIVLYIMGYYVITSLIKERINMIKQLQEVSLKSLDMINKNAEGLEKLAGFLHNTQLQLNDLATKVIKLERGWDLLEADLTKLDKRLESVMDQLERVVKKQVEDYERSKN
jgi:septal ring factor EnvC (AmiA/AmiB activator)